MSDWDPFYPDNNALCTEHCGFVSGLGALVYNATLGFNTGRDWCTSPSNHCPYTPQYTTEIHLRDPRTCTNEWRGQVCSPPNRRFLKMAERTPWWRAFMTRKKASPGSKDQEDRPPHSTDSETQSAPDKSAPAARVSTQPAALKEELSSSGISSGDPFDDARLEPLFNEQTCRRNLKVSRSGRFKEKRRVRASLPEDYQDETAERKDENPR